MRGEAGLLAHRQRRELDEELGDRGEVGDGDRARSVTVVIMAMPVIIVGMGSLGFVVVTRLLTGAVDVLPGFMSVCGGLVTVIVSVVRMVVTIRRRVDLRVGMIMPVVAVSDPCQRSGQIAARQQQGGADEQQGTGEGRGAKKTPSAHRFFGRAWSQVGHPAVTQ
jgi:hypothetical protein